MKTRKYLLLFTMLAFVGCWFSELEAERDREGVVFVRENVGSIRVYLIQQKILNDKEIGHINLVEPNVSVYMWGAGAGSFCWSWELPSEDKVSVNYDGSTEVLDPNFITCKRTN